MRYFASSGSTATGDLALGPLNVASRGHGGASFQAPRLRTAAGGHCDHCVFHRGLFRHHPGSEDSRR
eukprot:s158_g13.t1